MRLLDATVLKAPDGVRSNGLHVILRHGAVRLTGEVLTLALAVWNLAIFAVRGHHFVNLGGGVCLAVAGALYLSAFTRARRERQRQDSARNRAS